MYICG